jgi:hypothetical protein
MIVLSPFLAFIIESGDKEKEPVCLSLFAITAELSSANLFISPHFSSKGKIIPPFLRAISTHVLNYNTSIITIMSEFSDKLYNLSQSILREGETLLSSITISFAFLCVLSG